jgi:hypothetical protein
VSTRGVDTGDSFDVLALQRRSNHHNHIPASIHPGHLNSSAELANVRRRALQAESG